VEGRKGRIRRDVKEETYRGRGIDKEAQEGQGEGRRGGGGGEEGEGRGRGRVCAWESDGAILESLTVDPSSRNTIIAGCQQQPYDRGPRYNAVDGGVYRIREWRE
jgi:hypothetical protein